MKVAIDIQTTLGQPTGFGFYVSNLIKYLERIPDLDLLKIRPPSEKDFSTPQRFFWDQFTFPRLAKGVDLLHQPCFSAPLFHKGPVLVTVHDIISILFPRNIPLASRLFYSKWMPFSYYRAAAIITISQSTKNDIVKKLGINPNKIRVTPLAVDDKFKHKVGREKISAVKRKYDLPEKYILHVGTLEPRKNLSFLIDVFSWVIKDNRFRDYFLVITGKKGWYYEGLFTKVYKLGLSKKVIFTGYVDEADKPALYQGAMLFAFPSVYEGFGLPPLEAMASGVPVISSNTSSMPEVISDAGILLAPDDLDGWVKNIIRILSNSDLAAKMKQTGQKQASRFSWEKTAEKTFEVYKEVVGGRKV